MRRECWWNGRDGYKLPGHSLKQLGFRSVRFNVRQRLLMTNQMVPVCFAVERLFRHVGRKSFLNVYMIR